jgi:predicted permease
MGRAMLQGVRWMVRRPIVSLTCVLCLAVGIAACTAAWTLLDAIVFRPYGLRESHRLVVVWETDPARNEDLIEVSQLNFLDWQRESRTVEAMATFGSQHWPALARLGSEMVPLATRGVSETFFDVVGVRPILGRTFEPRDAHPVEPPPLMLSHRMWQARFGGQPTIVGQKVFLDGADHVVVGVMPAGFAYPEDPDAWVSVERVLAEAFQTMPVDQQRRIGVLEVLARRNVWASNDDVRAELTAIIRGLSRRYSPGTLEPTTAAAVTPFAEIIVGRLGPRLWIAFGMSVAVLLLACANVAAIRVAQLRERAAELGARMFLGATSRRLIEQMASECIPLSVAGGVAGSLLWLALVNLISSSTAIGASGVTLLDRWPLFAFVIVILAAVSWVLNGALPAVAAARWSARQTAHGAARVISGASRVGAPLLLGQAALAIAVVTLSGAALQTFQRLSGIDLGFATSGVTLVDFALPAWKYKTVADQEVTRDGLQTVLRELPSVSRVAGVSVRPFRFGEIVDGLPVRRAGDALVTPDDATGASRVAVTPHYFEALGQPLVEGRTFTDFDRRDTEAVAIVSRTLARALFGGRSALGERIETFSLSEKWRARLVVGIAGDAQYRGLERPSMEVYVPHTQVQTSMGTLVVASSAAVSESSVRQALRRVEPDVAIEGFQTTADLRASVLSPARLLTTIVSLLGAAGLLLLTLGVFGAAAGLLRAAWPEIAVRQAIGARPFQAARAPLRVLIRALCVGVLAGLAVSPAVLVGASSLGLSWTGNTLVPLAMSAVVVAVAAAAAIVPSLSRAANASPGQLLRDGQLG